MTSFDESESYSSYNEQLNEFNEYEGYPMPEYSSRDAFLEALKIPKWKKTPRTAADFSESKSSISGLKDSEYEAWLENYYQEFSMKQTNLLVLDKQVDTSDLVDEPTEIVTTPSLFPPIKKGFWYESTKYWGPKDSRRHWPLRSSKEEYCFLPSFHPHLNLRSRYGRYLSLLNSAAAVPEFYHRKVACSLFYKAVRDMINTNPQILKFMFCDTLCNFKWFDFISKTVITRALCKFLRKQYNLEKVYFENMELSKLDGIVLLCALSKIGGCKVKELHMWKMFGFGQCPLLERELSSKGEMIPPKEIPSFFIKNHYLQILNAFYYLTHLSVNYSYFANRKGDALLNLRCLRVGILEKLRVLCLMEERPLLTNPGYGVGGWKIADGVWRRAAELCPKLQVCFVFVNIPQYENIIPFLSKSIPMSHIYISSGIDFNFDVPWDVDSTLLEIRNWYSATLENLCLHLWHQRDLLDFVIKCKILEEFPNLLNFEFIGVLENIETLEEFCCNLSQGTYKLKTLLFWVEEQHTNQTKLKTVRKRLTEIRNKYSRRFQVIDLDADLQTYSL